MTTCTCQRSLARGRSAAIASSDQVEFKLFFPDRSKDPTQYQAAPEDGHAAADYGDPQIASIQVAGTFQTQLGQQNWDFAAAPALITRAASQRLGVALSHGCGFARRVL